MSEQTIDPGAAPAGEEPTRLRRAVSRRLLFFFVLGDMLGGGIYALVGVVGGEVGGAIWSSFLLAFVLASLTAFAYVELATKYPRAAGSALYVNRAFGIPFLTFMVGFAVMASGVTSAATLARGFAGDSLGEFVDVPVVPVAVGFLLVVGLVNLRGIAESLRANVAFTVIEVGGLLLIVAVGVAAVAGGTADFSRNFEFRHGEGGVLFAIVSGATLAFYALIGFEDSVNIAEEVRAPSRAYPRALLGGLLAAGLIYVAVTMTASAVVETGRLADSSAPLLEVVREGPLSIPPKLFAAITLFALANGALINMIMASRLVYGMSNQGVVASVFGAVLPGRRTPWLAIAFTTAIATVLVATGDLATLADTTVVLLLCVFAIVNVSVLVLRREPVDHEHFSIAAPVPIAGALVSVLLLTRQDAEIFARAGVLLCIGAILFLLTRAAGHRKPAAPQST